jgi:hypothetical protein
MEYAVSEVRTRYGITFEIFLVPVVWRSEFLAANPEVPGSVPGAIRFSEQQWFWNGVHSVLVRINEELLERKVATPV